MKEIEFQSRTLFEFIKEQEEYLKQLEKRRTRRNFTIYFIVSFLLYITITAFGNWLESINILHFSNGSFLLGTMYVTILILVNGVLKE